LAATDYFTKWAEVVPLKEVKASDVVKFFKTHVLYRFGTPQRMNIGELPKGSNFRDGVFDTKFVRDNSKLNG
jgi:hypothetical protein